MSDQEAYTIEDSSPEDEARIKRRRHYDWSGAATGLVIGLLLLGLGRLGWLRSDFDIFSAFTIQAAILALASFLGLLMPRLKTTFASLIFVLGLAAYGSWPSWSAGADGTVPPGTKRLRVATFNIHSGIGQEQQILNTLKALDADVVVLAEYDSALPALNQGLAALYPHAILCEQMSRCDVSLFSRVPITQVKPFLQDNGPGAVAARLGPDYRQAIIVGVHTTRFPHLLRQQRQLATLAQRLAREPGPVIVAGDFNATGQSRVLTDFAQTLGLRTMTNFPTFPTTWGLPQLAIDQIMVSDEIQPVGPQASLANSGSDHLPLARSFAIPTQK